MRPETERFGRETFDRLRVSIRIVMVFALGSAGVAGQPAAHQHGPADPSPPPAAHAGHAPMGQMAFGPLPDSRDASGSAWQPDASHLYAHHGNAGSWSLMTHYNAFLGYTHQSGPRGDQQFNSLHWLMLMGTRRTDVNEITLRGMFSLEPWTTTRQGYPLLFQSGETYQGQPLIDRQHPHDFFMEVAARYRHLLSPETVLSVYAAPAGEPALGPAAFPHRMSAMDNPAAPISHHWLDSTHISFGVVTAGIARRTWQLEGSFFNGREPDEGRWDFDFRRLDSQAGRFTWNPTREVSAQVSHGRLESPEALHPGDVRRTTASVIHIGKLSETTHLVTTVGWGRNDHGDHVSDAFLLEPAYVAKRFSIFGRGEYVEKSGEELGLLPGSRRIPVRQVTLGGTRELVQGRPWQIALGASVTYSMVPRDLDAVYGRNPLGYWVFLRMRPTAMEH